MDQAEQLRNIIKMKNQAPVPHARVITITSGKGGVGKSNTAVNLGLQFQKLGKRVLIFDADFGLANVEVMFGAIPKYNLSDVIFRGKDICEVITPGPNGIQFISGGSGVVGLNNLTNSQLAFLIRNLSQLDALADVVIIDTGAGVSDSVMEFVLASTETILVTTPEPSSMTDAYSLLKVLFNHPRFYNIERQPVRVIANRVRHADEGQAVFNKLNSVVEHFLNGKIEFLGMVPQDTNLERAVRQQKPVSLLYPDSRSSNAFERIARQLCDCKEESIPRRGFAHILSELLSKRK